MNDHKIYFFSCFIAIKRIVYGAQLTFLPFYGITIRETVV